MNSVTNPLPPQDFSHILQTGRDGALDAGVSSAQHVAELVARAVASGQTIVLHLHGGLVTKEAAYEMVNRLQPMYREQDFFPIFVVWRTGIFDAVKNAQELVKRPLFTRLLIRLLKHLVARYGSPLAKGGIGKPAEPDDAQVEKELGKRNNGAVPYANVDLAPAHEVLTAAEENDLRAGIQGDSQLKSEWVKEVQTPPPSLDTEDLGIDRRVREEALQAEREQGKALVSAVVLAEHAVKIAARVVKRFFKHRDHGLHATIVEEILRDLYFDQVGTEVWQFMKQDSADTFQPAATERGGVLLMRLLGEAVKKTIDESRVPPKISIVGHSAGSIYASNLLTHLAQERQTAGSPWNGSHFQLDKLALLAPAATSAALAKMLTLHAATPLFRSFRMYSLTDQDEQGYYEVPVLYPGSLLYIISGLLESEDDGGTNDMPIVGMQRYARTVHPFEEPEVLQVWKFLQQDPDQLVWSGDARGPGLNCDSKRHGDFFRTTATIESFLHFLK